MLGTATSKTLGQKVLLTQEVRSCGGDVRCSVSDLALRVALGLAASSPDPVRRIAHNSIHHLPKGKRDFNKCFWLYK